MTDEPVTLLSEDESWDRLGGVALGRLVTTFAGEPEIFPVNYVVQDRTVLFRSAEGTKLFSAIASSTVVFEADDHTASERLECDRQGTGKDAAYRCGDHRSRSRTADAVGNDAQIPVRAGDPVRNHRPPLQVRARTRTPRVLSVMSGSAREQGVEFARIDTRQPAVHRPRDPGRLDFGALRRRSPIHLVDRVVPDL